MENQNGTPGKQSIERSMVTERARIKVGAVHLANGLGLERYWPATNNRADIGILHPSCVINRPEIVHGVSARTEITRLSTLNKLKIPARRTDLCSLFRQ